MSRCPVPDHRVTPSLKSLDPLSPEPPIQRPVLDRFRDVLGLNSLRPLQIGNRTRDFEDTVVRRGGGPAELAAESPPNPPVRLPSASPCNSPPGHPYEYRSDPSAGRKSSACSAESCKA